jgi:polyferredoxin
MAKKQLRSWTAKLAAWRLWFQAAFLLAWLDPLLLRLHGFCSPVFHCHSCPLATFACPIGVLANFSAIHVFPFVAVGVLLIAGVVLGGFVCGWVCPFGFLQDLVGRIPTRKFVLPGGLRHVRFLVLFGLVLAVPYWWGEAHPLFFCRLCPAGALEAALPNTVRTAVAGQDIAWPTVAKSAILVAVVLAMLFTWRPWCTVLCPLGAIFSLCNLFSFVFIRVQPESCTDCDMCRSLCRYGGGPREMGGDMQCIRCLDCTKCKSVVLASVLARRTNEPSENQLVTIGDPPHGGPN